ncbi:MAG: EamA family transporter RarD [Gammaproteobacteria bacterium]|nr:EamA family transporter RarD [Gammaproteobacteria bacterium]
MGEQLKYILLAVAAFGMWGLFPVYFKLIETIPATEIMAHRIVWSLVFIVLFMWLFKRRFALRKIWQSKKLLGGLVLSSIMIAINWSLYVWAVVHGQVLSTSLGYFINPIISVFLGMIFLGERLSFKRVIALLLVILAVINLIVQAGQFPWLSLTLAFSFAFYGLIRKQLEIDSLNGLLFEIIILIPIALGYLMWLTYKQNLAFGSQGLGFDLLIMLSGVITLLPLVLFAASLKGINLSTVAFIQYLAPTLSFILAVFIYDEPFDQARLISFVLIWTALALISFDVWRRLSREA